MRPPPASPPRSPWRLYRREDRRGPASAAPRAARPTKHKWGARASAGEARRVPGIDGALRVGREAGGGSARALPQEDGRPKPAAGAAASARMRALGRARVCQSRNHCTKSDATGDWGRVTTDSSVCAKRACCPRRQFCESQVHVHWRGARKDASLPQCCSVGFRSLLTALPTWPALYLCAVGDEGPHPHPADGGASCYSECPPPARRLRGPGGGRGPQAEPWRTLGPGFGDGEGVTITCEAIHSEWCVRA